VITAKLSASVTVGGPDDDASALMKLLMVAASVAAWVCCFCFDQPFAVLLGVVAPRLADAVAAVQRARPGWAVPVRLQARHVRG